MNKYKKLIDDIKYYGLCEYINLQKEMKKNKQEDEFYDYTTVTLPFYKTPFTLEDAIKKYTYTLPKCSISPKIDDKSIICSSILGDMIGRPYEMCFSQNLDCLPFFKMIDENLKFTDDTVMTVATLDVLLNSKETIMEKQFESSYIKWAKKYPAAGYGPAFNMWFNSPEPHPYGSFGNGSAMRISPCILMENFVDVITTAYYSAICTHNHEEGIKGAIVTAVCLYIAKTYDKSEAIKLITDYMKKQYPISQYVNGFAKPLEEFSFTCSCSCQLTVPIAIKTAVITNSFEEFCETIIKHGGDTDTLCAIGGPISACLNGFNYTNKVLSVLPEEFIKILNSITI